MKKGKNRSQIARKNILRLHKAKARKIEHRANVKDLKTYDHRRYDGSTPILDEK